MSVRRQPHIETTPQTPPALQTVSNADFYRILKKYLAHTFICGGLEGIGAALVIGICTHGLGFLIIPLLGLLRGLQKSRSVYFSIYQSIFETEKLYIPDLLSGIFLGLIAGMVLGWLLSPYWFGLSVFVYGIIGGALGLFEAGVFHYLNKYSIESQSFNLERVNQNYASIIAKLGALVSIVLMPWMGGLSLLVGTIIGWLAGYVSSKYIHAFYLKSLPHKILEQETGASIGGTMGAMISLGISLAFMSSVSGGLLLPVCVLIGAVVGSVIGCWTLPKLKDYLCKSADNAIIKSSTVFYVQQGIAATPLPDQSPNSNLSHSEQDIDDQIDVDTEQPLPTRVENKEDNRLTPLLRSSLRRLSFSGTLE